MDSIIQYFESIPSLHRTLFLMGGIIFFWILEGVLPIIHMQYRKVKHAGVNLFFTVTTLLINLAFAFLIVKTSDWVVAQEVGLFQWIADWPLSIKIILGLMVMDFVGAYLIHFIEHKVYWMWKFHVIHHSDENVDTTTALRHHPGESVFRAVFTTLAVLIAGAPIWLVMLYQSISALLSQFNHANLKLPPAIDKLMSHVIVTPAMHRIHHHNEQPLTDTNYGNIFSLWDRLLKTFAFVEPDKVVFGLDVFKRRSGHIGDLLEVPFDKENYHRD